MNLDGLVSIIMPAHNSAIHLAEAVSSVLKQTYAEWELFICDDNSSDSTETIASSLAAKDKRIYVISLETRRGPAGARNAGIALSKGRWLAFLDSDDYWEPQKLEKSIKFAQESGSPLTFTSYRTLTEPSKRMGGTVPVPASLSYSDLLKSNQIATSTVVVDRRVCPTFTMPENVFFDDYVAWLGILKQGLVAYSLPTPLTVYRTGRKSFSSNKIRAGVNVFRILRDVEGLPFLPRYKNFAIYALRGIKKTLTMKLGGFA